MLSFHFLGAPHLAKNNRRIVLDTRKAIALAAYLALTQTAHEREELATFFYPDADTTRARAALRRTLSTLKTALGENVLDIERETIALDTSHAQVDVLQFRGLAQENTVDSLMRAAALYQGDFLAGFTLRDSPAFDEWQFFETESLRKQFATVLEDLVAHEQEQGAFKRAIEFARRWLALDPLHEPAHRALMRLYWLDGQRAAALRQYQECVRQLEQELGVSPLPETTELYRAIQENRQATEDRGRRTDDERGVRLRTQTKDERRRTENRGQTADGGRRAKDERRVPIPGSRPPEGRPLSDFPLVGRDGELGTILRIYARISPRSTSAGCGQLVVLEGEAGIGKTRLAEEALAILAAGGAAVLTARSYTEQRLLAYAPFGQALRTALAEPLLAARLKGLPATTLVEAARLVPEIAPNVTAPSLEGPGAQARFFEAVTQVVLALTHNGATGVLFLDDAQWLDDASLDLLAFLIRRLKTAPLLILLTWRGEEIAADHSLRQLYADALREERAQLIALSRLERAQAQTLIQVATERGAPIDAALAERLYRESEGQPFFLVEALKLLERTGATPADDALPASVRALLQSRLARVGETARQLLSTAAVVGRSFPFELLHAASGRSEEETIAGLEELEAQGLVTQVSRSGAPQYDFTHEKLRVFVYEETSLARRRLLHRRIAETMTQRAYSSADAATGRIAGQVARHFRAGGDEPRAAEFFKRAGDYARSVFANHEALEQYTAALALGYPDAAALHTGIGDVHTLLGEYDAALAAYETAAAFGSGDAEANIARVYLRRGEWDHAAQHFRTALGATQENPARARLYADLALAQHHSQKDADALKDARRALKLAQKGHDQQALAQAHNILGILARTRGEWDTARKHLEASRELAESMNEVGAHAAALNNLALVSHATGDDAQALEHAHRALELVTRAGDRHREAALHNHLADLYHALGREAESMEQLKQAVGIYAEIGGEAGAWQPEIWKLEEW